MIEKGLYKLILFKKREDFKSWKLKKIQNNVGWLGFFEFQTSSLDHIELFCVPLFNSKVPESPCDNDLNRNNI